VIELDTLDYISLVESLSIFSTTFTQCAPKAIEFAEIKQNNGHYAIQGHSRSPQSLPYDKRCALLGIDRLELRRLRADLIMCYRISRDWFWCQLPGFHAYL